MTNINSGGHDKSYQVLGDRIAFLEAELAEAVAKRDELAAGLKRIGGHFMNQGITVDGVCLEIVKERVACQEELDNLRKQLRDAEPAKQCIVSRTGVTKLPQFAVDILGATNESVGVCVVDGKRGGVEVMTISAWEDLVEGDGQGAGKPTKREWKVGDRAMCHIHPQHEEPVIGKLDGETRGGWWRLGFQGDRFQIVHETHLIPIPDEA